MSTHSSKYYTIESINKAYQQGLNNGRFEAEQEIECKVHKEYIKGKTDGYGEGYQHGFTLAKEEIAELDEQERKLVESYGYNNGYEEATAEFELGNDFTNKLEDRYFQKGYSEGYGDAIKEASNNQTSGETTEYMFGVEDCESGYTREQFNVTESEDVINFIISNLNNIKSYTQMGNVAKFEFCTDNNYHGQPHTPNEETQEAMQEVLDKSSRKHSHYYKDVRHLDYVDVYQVNKLFPVKDDTDCILHARKKLLVCGGRGGGKDMLKDVTEAYDTLKRYLEIEGHLDD